MPPRYRLEIAEKYFLSIGELRGRRDRRYGIRGLCWLADSETVLSALASVGHCPDAIFNLPAPLAQLKNPGLVLKANFRELDRGCPIRPSAAE